MSLTIGARLQAPHAWAMNQWQALKNAATPACERMVRIATAIFLAVATAVTYLMSLAGRAIEKLSGTPAARPVGNLEAAAAPQAAAPPAAAPLLGMGQMVMPSVEEIQAEFRHIKDIHPQRDPEEYRALFQEGLKEANQPFNRYRNILPLDATRVVYDGDKYCNANWIAQGDWPIVATQGPLDPREHNNFWPMVHEHGSTVVMLTNHTENGRVKCDPYWPHNQAEYGAVRVVNKREAKKVLKEASPDPDSERIVERRFKVGFRGQEKNVAHFHLENWKDHGIAEPEMVVLLLQEVMARHEPREGIVVHCSAGIGRSGVFIAALLAVLELQRNPQLKQQPGGLRAAVIKGITDVRTRRDGSIQTAAQHRMVYQVVQKMVEQNAV